MITRSPDFNPAAPGAIGGMTPAAGTFIGLTVTNGDVILSGVSKKIAFYGSSIERGSILADDGNLLLTSAGAGGISFYTNGVNQLEFHVSHTTDAVNYLNVTGAAASAHPVLSALGSDTNINITLTPKGSGVVQTVAPLNIGNTVAAAIGIASTHKVTMTIGGSVYYLLASNV